MDADTGKNRGRVERAKGRMHQHYDRKRDGERFVREAEAWNDPPVHVWDRQRGAEISRRHEKRETDGENDGVKTLQTRHKDGNFLSCVSDVIRAYMHEEKRDVRWGRSRTPPRALLELFARAIRRSCVERAS